MSQGFSFSFLAIPESQRPSQTSLVSEEDTPEELEAGIRALHAVGCRMPTSPILFSDDFGHILKRDLINLA